MSKNFFCKKCGSELKSGNCLKCDNTSNYKALVILFMIILFIIHSYTHFGINNKSLSALSVAGFFGQFTSTLFLAIIPTSIIYLINKRKYFVLILLGIAIIFSFLQLVGIQSENIENNNEIKTLEFYEDNFYIDFPTKPEITTLNTEELKIKSYSTTDGLADYYVKIGVFDEKMTSYLKNEKTANYYIKTTIKKLVPLGATNVNVVLNKPILFFEKYLGAQYVNTSTIDGVEYYHKGIIFIREDGSTVQVSMNYPKKKDSEMTEKYNTFFASLKLK